MRGLIDALVFNYLVRRQNQSARLMNVVFAPSADVTLITCDTAVANRDAEAAAFESQRKAEIAEMRKWLTEQFSFDRQSSQGSDTASEGPQDDHLRRSSV